MKLAVFFATGSEEVEALMIIDLLRRAEILVDLISVNDEKLVKSSHNVLLMADKTVWEIQYEDYDMLILPGGLPGIHNLSSCESLMKAMDEFHAKGKFISAICAAPSIFGKRGYLKGKEACSYPAFQDQLEGAEVKEVPVVVADHITTGRGLGAAIDFGLAIVERYKGKEKADQIAESIVYDRNKR